MRLTSYVCAENTTQHHKGECRFSVEVVPDQAGFKVTSFGPSTLKLGELPEWLK
jgi:hypothetical protein